MDFIYDESGRPFAVAYSKDAGANYTTYFYATNAQGDVEGLFRVLAVTDEETNEVHYEQKWYGRYYYDAWGNVTVTNSSGGTASATSLAVRNPIRYRGYYYDSETGFYYLQSRYYDPANHRFINADSYASTGQGFVGMNMFAYGLNNPVNAIDINGEYSIWYYLIIMGKMGYLHRLVQEHILANSGGTVEIELWLERDHQKIGRADVMQKKTGLIWEVKSIGVQATGKAQAESYIGATALRTKEEVTGLGPANAFSGSFTVTIMLASYRIHYKTIDEGLIVYWPESIPYLEQPDYVFVFEETKEPAQSTSESGILGGILTIITVGGAIIALGRVANSAGQGYLDRMPNFILAY